MSHKPLDCGYSLLPPTSACPLLVRVGNSDSNSYTCAHTHTHVYVCDTYVLVGVLVEARANLGHLPQLLFPSLNLEPIVLARPGGQSAPRALLSSLACHQHNRCSSPCLLFDGGDSELRFSGESGKYCILPIKPSVQPILGHKSPLSFVFCLLSRPCPWCL